MYKMTYAQIFCIFTGARPKRPPKSAVTGAKKAWRTLVSEIGGTLEQIKTILDSKKRLSYNRNMRHGI